MKAVRLLLDQLCALLELPLFSQSLYRNRALASKMELLAQMCCLFCKFTECSGLGHSGLATRSPLSRFSCQFLPLWWCCFCSYFNPVAWLCEPNFVQVFSLKVSTTTGSALVVSRISTLFVSRCVPTPRALRVDSFSPFRLSLIACSALNPNSTINYRDWQYLSPPLVLILCLLTFEL